METCCDFCAYNEYDEDDEQYFYCYGDICTIDR